MILARITLSSPVATCNHVTGYHEPRSGCSIRRHMFPFYFSHNFPILSRVIHQKIVCLYSTELLLYIAEIACIYMCQSLLDTILA